MDYRPPRFLFNGHLQTIYPSLFRKVTLPEPKQVVISTPDDDFLEADIYANNKTQCVIISHGLEGSARRAYVLGMARAFLAAGFDVLAWNYRGCGSRMNNKLRFYHSGATDDLNTVVEYAAGRYEKIVVLGFSLGGNITLKYMGDGAVHPQIAAAVALSVPIDLHSSCLEISKPHNRIYANRFLRSLKKKVRAKAAVRTDLDARPLERIDSLVAFDDFYTGPVHGFRDAIDYYTQCSALPGLRRITVPTLLVNALNDPFLSPLCFPKPSPSSALTTIYPAEGGHVGFPLFGQKGLYWSEMQAVSFIQRIWSPVTH